MVTSSYENRPPAAVVYIPVTASVTTHAVAAKTTCAVTTVTATAPIMSNNQVYPTLRGCRITCTFTEVEASLRHRTY